MRILWLLLMLLCPAMGWAQFTPNTVLTAGALNAALAAPTITGGSITGVPVSATTLAASGAVSGAGFTALLSPYAPLNNPTFTGIVTIPSGSNVIGYAPLNNPSFTGTVTIPSGASIAGYAPLNSPTFSGTVSIPSGALISGYAQLASPIFTGSVTIPAFASITTPNIYGVTNGTSAVAGTVGEYVCAQVTNGGSPTGCATNLNTPVSMTTSTTKDVTSISLTAGEWDVSGNVLLLPAGSTVISTINVGINTVSATPATNPYASLFSGVNLGAGASISGIAPTRTLNLTTTTTVYLNVTPVFTTSTCTAIGFIRARRVH